MQFGQGSISTTQNTIPNSAGAALADNGLSVDAARLKVVFGNDVGGALAILLSNRQIPMNAFWIELLGATEQNGQLILSAGNIDPLLTETKFNVEGATTTKRRCRIVNQLNSPLAFDPINDNFHVIISENSTE